MSVLLASAPVLVILSACGMPEPDTPLTRAAQSGSAAQIKAVLLRGADPNGRDGFGLTPLVRAARLGHAEAARALLAVGADPNRMDGPPSREGWSPLMNAVHKGQLGVVQILLEAGADANAKTADGATALMLATGEPRTDIVRALLDAGADPGPGAGGSAALTNAVANCEFENVKVLLEKAPGLRLEKGIRGHAALWIAKVTGHRDILDLLERARAGRAERESSTTIAPPVRS
jgi:cytohesin